jgi:hypothetical protein
LVSFCTTNSATTLKPTLVFTARKKSGKAYLVVRYVASNKQRELPYLKQIIQ